MLQGRVAIITGAGRGIGAAAARVFGREGAKVVINDLDVAEAEASAEAVRAAGGEAIGVGGSVTDRAMPDRLVQAALDAYGTPDIIVNNAGFLWDGVLHKMTDKQFDEVIDCHLAAPFRLIRAAAPHIRAAAKLEAGRDGLPRDRAIINVSSTSGLHGNPGQANYASAKAGITGLTKTLAKEWGPRMFARSPRASTPFLCDPSLSSRPRRHSSNSCAPITVGVRANAIAFGMIDTRMTNAFSGAVEVAGEKVPQGLPDHVAAMWNKNPDMLKMIVPLARKGTAEEAAAGMCFLASPMSSYVTGHTLEVTGGFGI